MKMRMTLLSPLALGAVDLRRPDGAGSPNCGGTGETDGDTDGCCVTAGAVAVGVGAWATCRWFQHLYLDQHLNKGFQQAQRQC